MWLPMAGDADGDAGKKVRYPIRPSEPDCVFYLKTGSCKFGFYCRFNHPRVKRVDQDRRRISGAESQIIKESDKGFPKTVDQCKYNLMPGGCKLGEACTYSHIHDATESIPVELNALGLPVRRGERLCYYYMRNGICRYNRSCKFHHPEPSPFTELQFGCQNTNFLQSTTWAMHLPSRSQALMTLSDDSGSKLDILQSNRPVVSPEWLNQYEGQIRRKEFDESQSQNGIKYDGFSVALACIPNFLKGHPSESAACLLSSIGLPQRPDHPVCIHYSRYGICKYGPACKFDHPGDESTEKPSNVLKMS